MCTVSLVGIFYETEAVLVTLFCSSLCPLPMYMPSPWSSKLLPKARVDTVDCGGSDILCNIKFWLLLM